MLKKILITVLSLLTVLFFIPMPHGGSIGSNFYEGLRYEIKKYLSLEAKESREREKKEWTLQKEEARRSWETFERENPQYFPEYPKNMDK